MIDNIRRQKMIKGGGGFFHGAAEARDTYGYIKKGTVGMITAYLPEENIFAVIWPNKNLVTYKCTEEEFEKQFELSAPDEVLIA